MDCEGLLMVSESGPTPATVSQFRWEEAHAGDLVVVKAAQGWKAPAGWTVWVTEPFVWAYRHFIPGDLPVREAIEIYAYRGVSNIVLGTDQGRAMSDEPQHDLQQCPMCGSDNIESSGIGQDRTVHCTDCEHVA